jgi:Raf kinase inhibitor-like YbhB/YbcL family protein
MASGSWTRRITLILTLLAVVAAGVFLLLRRHGRADIAQGQTLRSIAVETSSFTGGGDIPVQFTCDGAGLSPEIHWPSATPGTKSLALVMDDRDAPLGFVHWIVYDIPAEVHKLAEGVSSQAGLPQGAVEGINSGGTAGYTGPCPPGTKPHHYIFRLYALDVPLDLPPGRNKEQLAEAVKDHVLAEGRLTGVYARGR